ncbi:MAG: ATP-dependent Clp protease adapter ClpS [Verrucomicrobiales bacterium]|nr:ATP-dependent Clp protease adapter ClpS [Verrucomicrobiales bacterium]
MSEVELPLLVPDTEDEIATKSKEGKAPVFRVIVWNDPVNLMNYVSHVFQKVFGWDRKTAEKHMLEVHQQGKSVVARESLEKAEHYVHRLHAYSLHATMEPD